jgi:hypothetical protein
MLSSECPQCDAAVPILAGSCSHCGAANPARLGMIAVAAAVVVLVVAAAGAVYVATRPQQRPVAGEGNSVAVRTVRPSAVEGKSVGPVATTTPTPTTATATGDFGWLASAMMACDEVAQQQPNKLHFLMIPLIADRKDMPDWRLIAGSAIGNGLTIPANDALGGLRRGTLRVYADQYVFSVQDALSNEVYRWNAAAGVKWFSTAEAVKIARFRVQFQPRSQVEDKDWGALYNEHEGTCLWVAAIVNY